MKLLRPAILIVCATGFVACQAQTSDPAQDKAEAVTADSAVAETLAGASSETVVTGNCTDPEYRQLDFWVGEWDLSWTQQDGSIARGSNTITLSPFGNCVIQEQFDGAPGMQFKGMSHSTWHKPSKLWRQAWVDNQGGYFSLYGGPNDDRTFALVMERPGNVGPHRRMIWEDISKDSLVWRWQGKPDIEGPWVDQWVINYARKTD